MKRASLGQQIKSLEYTRERLELYRIHGDLGRLGGLLKQALANGADKQQIYVLLREIDLRQKEMKQAIRSVSHDSQAR